MPIPPIIPIHIYLYIYPYLYLHISHAASRDPIRSLVAICSHTLRTATCTHYYYNNRSIYKARDGVWQGGGSKCLGWDIHNGSIIMCNKLSKFVELLINFGATLPVEGKKNMKRNSWGATPFRHYAHVFEVGKCAANVWQISVSGFHFCLN